MKIMLTDRALKAMKTAQMVWDSAVPGFGVRVGKTGRLTFIVMRRLPGQKLPLRRTLGTYPLLTLAQAREAALEALRDFAQGIDPKAKQEAARRESERRKADTFAAVAEDFIERHVRKLRSAVDVEGTFRREIMPRWQDKPIAEISRRDVIELVENIAKSGRLHTAHHCFSYISKLFSWAVVRSNAGLEASPCAGVKRAEIIGSREPRDRVLNEVEIRALWQATEGLSYPLEPFVRLLLLTGARLREVAEMTWQEVLLDHALWTIGAERMKAATAHEIPLSKAAVELLRSLPRWPGPFVFSTTSGKRPISGFSKMKLRLDAAIGVNMEPWRFHDLRRTFRTGLSGLPIPSNVCELCIGHTQPGLHRVYDRHSYRDEKRRAFELWADRLMSIVEPQEPGNVVMLKAV